MKITIPYERLHKAETDYNAMIGLIRNIRYRYNRKEEPVDFYLYVPDGVEVSIQEMHFFLDLCDTPYYEINKIAILHEQLIKDPRKIKVEAEEFKEPLNFDALQKARGNLHYILEILQEFKGNLSKSNIDPKYMNEEKAYFAAVWDMIYWMYSRLTNIYEMSDLGRQQLYGD